MRILLFFMFIIIAVSCTANPNNDNSPPQSDQQNQVKVKQTVPEKRDIKDHQEVADRLEKLAKQMPQVKSANCVVIGNTAILGINVDEKLDQSKVGIIKYSVAEALRKDPHGVHAIVTADMDIAERLRIIRKEIKQGRPVSGFTKELGAIIGRIMPQLPMDVLPPENDEAIESEKTQ